MSLNTVDSIVANYNSPLCLDNIDPFYRKYANNFAQCGLKYGNKGSTRAPFRLWYGAHILEAQYAQHFTKT